MSKSSTLANLILETTFPLNDNGKEVYENGPVDVKLMISIARRIAQEALLDADPNKDIMKSFSNALVRFRNKNKGTIEGTLASTFCAKFVSSHDSFQTQDGKRTSYRTIAEFGPDEVAKHPEGSIERIRAQRLVDAAHQVLTNVVMPLLNTVGMNKVVTKHSQHPSDEANGTSPRPGFKHISVGFDPAASIHEEMKQGLQAGYIPSTSGFKLDPEFRKRWSVGLASDKEDAQFKITNTGVQDASGRYILKRYMEEQTGNYYQLKDVDSATVRQFFVAAGHSVSARTVEYSLKDKEGRRELDELMTFWAMSIHSSIHAIESGALDQNLFSNKNIDSYKSRTGIARESPGDFLGNEKGSSKGLSIYMPSSFFSQNKRFASTEMRTRGAAYDQRVISPNGTVMYPIVIKTPFSNVFPGSVNGVPTYHRTNNLMNVAVRNSPWLKTKLPPGVTRKVGAVIKTDVDWLLNNPFIDSEAFFSPEDVEMTTGVLSSTFRGGVETKDMTLADLVTIRFDHFVRTLSRSGGKELVLPGGGFADRGEIPVFSYWHAFGREMPVKFTARGDSASASLSRSLLHPLMETRLRSIMERRKYSTELWRSEMVRWGLLSEAESKKGALMAQAIELVTPEMVLRSPVLTKNSDWKIVGDKVIFGNRISLDHDKVYTLDVVSKYREIQKRAAAGLKGMELQAELGKLFDEIYEPHLKEFRLQMQTWGYRIPKHGSRNLDAAGINELYDSFFMLQHYTQTFSNELVLGDDSGYSSQGDADKRSVLAFSPGQKPLTGELGLSKVGKMVVFADQDKRWDGQSYTSPFHHVLAKKVFGGSTGMISDSSNKRVLVQPGLFVKSSDLHISRDMYYADPILRKELRRSLLFKNDDGSVDDTLQLLWDGLLGDGEASKEQYWKAVDAVQAQANAMGVRLTDLFTADSNVKNGQRGLNLLEDKGPHISQDFNMEDWAAQTKLDRSLEDGDKDVAYFGQLSFLAGLSSSPKGYMGRLHSLEAEMAHQYMDEVNVQIELSSGANRQEKVKNFLINNARNSFVRTSDLMSQAGHLLMNPDVDINNPIVAKKVVETFSTLIKKSALLPKMPGQHFTQASASGITNPTTGEALKGPRLVDRKYVPGEVVLSIKAFSKYGFTGDIRTIEQAIDWLKKDAANRKYLEAQTSKLLTDFDKDLTVFVARTPASSMGSGQLMRVIGFINDVGNVLFVPPEFNKYTGGDNDGDQLAVYLRSDRESKNERKRNLRDVQAEILDLIEEYYMDPDNAELVTMSVGVDLLDGVLEKLGEAPTLANSLPAATVIQTMAAKRQASAGANLVGMGASLMRSYAVMYRSMMDMSEEQRTAAFAGISPALRDSDGRFVIENIGAVLNGMLDNTKHAHMGRLGVTEQNVGLLMGLLMTGESLKDAVRSIRSPMIQGKVNQLEVNSTLTMSERYFFSIIGLSGAILLGEFIVPAEITNGILLAEAAIGLVQISMVNPAGLPSRIWGQQIQQMRMEYAAGANFEALLKTPPGHAMGERFPLTTKQYGTWAWQGALRVELAKKFNMPAIITKSTELMRSLTVVDYLKTILGAVITQGSPGFHDLLMEFANERGQAYPTEAQGFELVQLFDAMVLAIHMAEQWHGKPVKLRLGYAPMDLSTKGGQYRYLTEFPEFMQDLIDKVMSLPIEDERRQMFDQNAFIDEIRLVGNFRKQFQMRDGRKVFNNPELLRDVRDGLSNLSEIFTSDLMPRGMKFDGDFVRMLETYIILKDGFSQSRASMSRFLTDEELSRMTSAHRKVDCM